jgi:type IV secretion system protein VirD4
LRWLALLTAIAAATASLLGASATAGRALSGLASAGWERYLGQDEGSVAFVPVCLADAACGAAFKAAWLRAYPLYWPLLAVLAAWVAATLRVMAQPNVAKRSPGGARWAASRDLRAYMRANPDNPLRGYLGLSERGRMLRVRERERCAHTLVVGATGARKSTGYHKPNLLMDARDGVSAVVFDLKYPDPASGFSDTVAFFAGAGHDVQLFLPYGERTHRFPLPPDVRTLQGAGEIADMISPDTGEADVDFYRTEARRLVTGLLMALSQDGRATLKELYHLLAQGRRAVQVYVHRHPEAEIRSHLSGFFDFDLKVQGSIIGGLAGTLQAFADVRLERATTPLAGGNLELEAIGLRPTLLYIGLPQEHLQGARSKVLLRLLKRSLDLALLKTANSHGGWLPVHVSVYLDEFASLGVLPNIGENLATMRSRRVAYHISLQNRAQGEALYGRAAFHAFFTNNFRQVVLFPRSLKFEDAEYFSRTMGAKAALETSTGTSREGFLAPARRSEVTREVAEPLLSLEQMMTWPEHVGVLLASGTMPARVLMPRLDEPRVAGVRNPLHAFYRRAKGSLAPSLLFEVVLRGCDEPFAPPVPKESPPPPPPLQESQQALLKWVDALAKDATIEPHYNPKTGQLSKVSLSRVPGTLRHSPHIPTWVAKGWVKVQGDEIGLVGQGLVLLGPERLRQLQADARGGEKRNAGLSRKEAALLKRFIAANGPRLAGHPDYQSGPALGLYRPATVLLEKVLVTRLLEGRLPDGLIPRKVGPQGKQRWVVEVPLATLASYPALAAWWAANRRHLSDKDGALLPETVLLPKPVVAELLGHVPRCAKPSRPLLNGKRPYLLQLALPPESPTLVATTLPTVGP